MSAVRVAYRDRWVLAADKPQGLLVHGDGTGAPTLTDQIADLLREEGDATTRPQALQRLDVDTSGLVLLSLDPSMQPAFDALVAGHQMGKRYLAVVEGRLPRGTRTISLPLGRDRHDARLMRVSRTGKPSQTVVTPLAEAGGRTLVRVELLTGRRHQIRVHLAHLGFPIVGDRLYGRRALRGGRGQTLMLHALEEEFDHPVTGRHLLVRTEFPQRFLDAFPNCRDLWEGGVT